MFIWILGQLIATASPNIGCLYFARIVSGFGIGPLTVVGPVSLAEIAPTEIRGLITAWFSVVLLLSLFVAAFTVYGVFSNMAATRLQYQVVWFSPCIFLALCIAASFFVCESPRWLFLKGRREEGVRTLEKLRGLPAEHPRVHQEIHDIEESIAAETEKFDGQGRFAHMKGIMKETFLVPANLRRLQQAMISYALAQLSGANLVTSYFVPILKLMGLASDNNAKRALFLSCMYSMAKFFFTVIASFFFIDALGRRRSLFIGITLQMSSDIYLGVFIKYVQQSTVNVAASQAATAFIFIHGFGYAVGKSLVVLSRRSLNGFSLSCWYRLVTDNRMFTGLLVLPYVFAGEIWPNRIRSFGGALTQCFHWLFYYGVSAGMPSLLSSMDNWGAFIFFGGWCFVSLIYVYLMVPEIAGLSVEEIDDLFRGPWFNAYKRSKQRTVITSVESQETVEQCV